jgi:nitrate reductase assembly molybdenum cofactor insertion protein NarJ
MDTTGVTGEKIMAAQTLLTQHELQLAREAAEWRLLSLFFECPSDAWRAQVEALAREVEDTELKSAAHDALREASEGLYHHTFGPGGPAPAREASYYQSVELGYMMSEIQAYYTMFGFAPVTAEPVDHVSVEIAFIAYLRLKESYALACENIERAKTTAESAERFVEDHVARIAAPLAGHLSNSGISYLVQAGAALARRARQKMVAPVVLPILQEPDAEEDITCGSGCGDAHTFGVET